MTKSQFQLAFQKFMKIYEILGLLAVYVASYYKVLLKWAKFVCKRQSRAPLLQTYTRPVQYMNNRLLCNSMRIHMYCAVCNKQHTSIKFQTQPALQYIFLPSLVVLPDLAGMYNISCKRSCLSSKMYKNVHEGSLNFTYNWNDQILYLSWLKSLQLYITIIILLTFPIHKCNSYHMAHIVYTGDKQSKNKSLPPYYRFIDSANTMTILPIMPT